MSDKRLIPYPEERAIEDAAYTRGMTPTRLFPLLLPIWRVEVKAEVTESEPFDLIDRYLERGIAEAGLTDAAALARFFRLREQLVDRALRFLAGIEHVRIGRRGELSLTELGRRSLRDRTRYRSNRQDRRKLYFEACGSRPLTRPYYDTSTVSFLSGQEFLDAMKRRDGPAFRPLFPMRMFRDQALADLAALQDRDRFNLPERIDSPERVGAPELVYLPAYLVRAVGRDRPRYLIYTRVGGGTADEYLNDTIGGSRELAGTIESEQAAARDGQDEKRVTEWLTRRGLTGVRPARLPDGLLRVTFSARSFAPTSRDGDKAPVSLAKLGSFVVLGDHFFQVWCADADVRRRALMDRIGSYMSPRRRNQSDDIETRTARLGRQLELGDVGLPELRRMAQRAGDRDLVARLDEL